MKKPTRFVAELVAEVAAFTVTDEQKLLEFIPLAARLAALGQSEHLNKVEVMAKAIGANLDQLLVDRANEGRWDLKHALGEHLVDAIIDAQDWYCFAKLGNRLVTGKARGLFRKWFRRADDAEFDEKERQMIERFRRRFPVPPRYRLAVVHAPITKFMNFVLHGPNPRKKS